jgi:glycosyltransferase involved in cell wall biosynthesis
MPRISVCTPVLDMQDWLKITIKSVVAQTFKDWEMIIVDDGSTQDIRSVVDSFKDKRLKYHRLPENKGIAIAANTAFKLAKGEFINPLAADEWLMPKAMEERIAYMDEHQDVAMVFGLPAFIGDEPHDHGMTDEQLRLYQYEKQAHNRPRAEWVNTLMNILNVPLCSASSLWRRKVVEEMGYYDERLRAALDLDLYVRVFKDFEVRIEPKFWAGCRLRTDGKAISTVNTQNMIDMRREMKLVAQKLEGENNKIQWDGKVVIATPFYELRAFSPYPRSLVQTVTTLSSMGVKWDFWPVEGYSYVDVARNVICGRFLEDDDATDLFLIDSDESWDALSFLRVLFAPFDIVGASYPMKNAWTQWTAEMIVQDNHPIGRLMPDGSAFLKAHTLPAGFMRVRKAALLRFQEKYPELRYHDPAADQAAPDRHYTAFFECVREEGFRWGEDRTFSRRMNAIGEELWIEPRVSINHWGQKAWFGNLDAYLRSTSAPAQDMPRQKVANADT